MIEEAKLFTDGGSRGNPGNAAYAFLLLKMDDTVVEKYGEFIGTTTNNQAEYKGLIAGLSRAQSLGIKKLHVYMDSELIIKQLNGEYKVKHPDMALLFNQASNIAKQFDVISFTHVPRALNSQADAEVNIQLDKHDNLPR